MRIKTAVSPLSPSEDSRVQNKLVGNLRETHQRN